MGRTHGSVMQRRPTIKSPCVADKYHAPGERIAEISFPDGKGALLSLRQDTANGMVMRTRIEVYRQDDGIEVMHGEAKNWNYEERALAPQVTDVPSARSILGQLVSAIEEGASDIPTILADAKRVLCEPEPKRIMYAAFAGSALGSGITLHQTRLEALWACVTDLGLDQEERELDEESDEEDLSAALDDYCSARADDWDVKEVEIP